ncbi:Autophagy protein 7 [Microbotryomycetes sp. JL201]|nr:Autophagy protein 7 [Microbotryomycetes sp. JL201]
MLKSLKRDCSTRLGSSPPPLANLFRLPTEPEKERFKSKPVLEVQPFITSAARHMHRHQATEEVGKACGSIDKGAYDKFRFTATVSEEPRTTGMTIVHCHAFEMIGADEKFLPWQSSLSPSFWAELTQFKLFVSKLDDKPAPITATYTLGKTYIDKETGEAIGRGGALELDEQQGAFAPDDARASEQSENDYTSLRTRLRGTLRNYNTVEEFRNSDKNALLSAEADRLWDRIHDPSASLESLNPFLLVTFADLKKYRYYYWFAAPALVQKPGWQVLDEWQDWSGPELDCRESVAIATKSAGGVYDYAQVSLARSYFANIDAEDRLLIVRDPSAHPMAPGWNVRNLLTHLCAYNGITSLRLVLVRDKAIRTVLIGIDEAAANPAAERPGVVGWEKNEKGKLGPRMADLAPLMDPTRLADQAVGLNLQLMRWRIMPSLDLEKVKQTRALLLGAGTLGCYVARTLMAWGVRKITFVDSATVSFSNPVRQPLFEFEDSMNGGKPKAETAAAALRKIYPGVDAHGISMSIPMPGHPVSPNQIEATKLAVEQLERLFDEHDVVYLLMDSRESRWLPTVIGASKRKASLQTHLRLVMNVALGFDTYLVMRHGVRNGTSSPQATESGASNGRLGCYFCNDIVAPMDSLSDRTLDQMCTVTRPGIASIASSTAVELMVSILQHPHGPAAASETSVMTEAQSRTSDQVGSSPGSPLGLVPHQIRGFLAQFNNLRITGQAYDRCTGCSEQIISAYEEQGMEMLLKAFDDATHLERITGLDKLSQETDGLMESLDWSDDDEGSAS